MTIGFITIEMRWAMKKLNKYRQEIIDYLSDSTSEETASFVCGCDYKLALKMVEDGQLKKKELPPEHPWLSSKEYPHYKFYVDTKKESKCQSQN